MSGGDSLFEVIKIEEFGYNKGCTDNNNKKKKNIAQVNRRSPKWPLPLYISTGWDRQVYSTEFWH